VTTARKPARKAGRGPAVWGDDGTITVLTLGLFAVAIGVVVTVVDVSAVFLARRDLAGTCDTAALAAAQSVSRPGLYVVAGGQEAGTPGRLPLDLAAARRAAAAVAADAAGVRVRTLAAGPRAVDVACSRVVRLPVGELAGIGPVTVVAAATAETPVR